MTYSVVPPGSPAGVSRASPAPESYPPTLDASDALQAPLTDDEAQGSLAYVAGANAQVRETLFGLYTVARRGGSTVDEALLGALIPVLAHLGGEP